MNYLLISAGVLALLVGVVHSILGELLIFKKVRGNTLVPDAELPPLRPRNMRIIWANWHLASIFGFCIGAILIYLGSSANNADLVVNIIATAMLLSAALVLYATKAKHPGWLGLLGVAILCWLS